MRGFHPLPKTPPNPSKPSPKHGFKEPNTPKPFQTLPHKHIVRVFHSTSGFFVFFPAASLYPLCSAHRSSLTREKTVGDEGNENENSELPVEQANSDDDGIGNSAPPIVSSLATSSSLRSQRTKGTKGIPMMADLVTVVGEMVAAIRNPANWSEALYSRVMQVEGFSEHVLQDVFDYLQERETEGRRFMVKWIDMRQAWVWISPTLVEFCLLQGMPGPCLDLA
ncbi:Phosphoserine phosphatase domain 2-containing protein [Dioscorea alata]|uniref:Phosphoserine phosphatase domain 2-containing protein n=1 Tax=Dioscorea alata TaxID=55571 RepID=A0ACB7V7V7_DIOAL|nr:Phosphoserine phosphatase domain 2-containing protein [Dioscorea alata]